MAARRRVDLRSLRKTAHLLGTSNSTIQRWVRSSPIYMQTAFSKKGDRSCGGKDRLRHFDTPARIAKRIRVVAADGRFAAHQYGQRDLVYTLNAFERVTSGHSLAGRSLAFGGLFAWFELLKSRGPRHNQLFLSRSSKLDVGSNGSRLDVGSNGSRLDVGSNGSWLDIGSNGSRLDVGSNGPFRSLHHASYSQLSRVQAVP